MPKVTSSLSRTVSRFKPYIRWVILGGTLFFIAHTLRTHWEEVASIQISGDDWGYLGSAFVVTLLAHIWTGWVWGWILLGLGYPVKGLWSILVYLQTNIAKYLPGNVWHFYGRVIAARSVGTPIEVATISVVMEPLLMATSALIVATLSSQYLNVALQIIGLIVGLSLVHPIVLNPILKKLSIAKMKLQAAESPTPVADIGIPQLNTYPLVPLVGELGFLVLRGVGFILAVQSVYSTGWGDVPILFSAFSLAWTLGLIVPGAPGGIGVFEASALALLSDAIPSGALLSAIALYRLVNTLAEAAGAAGAWIIDKTILSKSFLK